VSTNTDVTFTDRPSTSRGSHGFLAPPGTMVFFRKGDLMIHKAVRSARWDVLPVAPDRTNKDSSSEQAGGPWIRGTYHESIGFLVEAAAMTLEPAGSDRQVRSPLAPPEPVHLDTGAGLA